MMSVHWKTTAQTHQCVKNTSEPMTRVSMERTRTNKCNYDPNLDQMLSPLCLSLGVIWPSWWPFRKRDRPQNLTPWPPNYKKVNKSNRVYEAWTEQVAKHTHSLVGTFQIFIHTELSNLHKGNSAESATCLRWWHLDPNIAARPTKWKDHDDWCT